MNRRKFIKRTAAAAAGAAAMPLLTRRAWAGAGGGEPVSIVLDASDPLAKEASSKWAAEYLRDALNARGASARVVDSMEQVPARQECVVATGRTSALAQMSGIVVPDTAEAVGFAQSVVGERKYLLAGGSDARGLVYALLELADRVQLGGDPLATLRGVAQSVEQPANRIRSVMRLFVSDVEDKPWYNDRAFWRDYLTMLAAQRFNRFQLALGIGYDGPGGLRDAYFYFAYPFLTKVPGYDVRVARLPEAEPAANLEMLKFISDEAALRGLHFQLGVWTHAYKWQDGPQVNYVIEGLTDDKQAEYSRDALRMVIEACPGIKGVTFRIHGESGVPEGSYDFWKTVFDGMVQSGRKLDLDMHAKGMDQRTIDIALATGLPVSVSPKFWGEFQGLPYMQAAIRSLEMPPRNARTDGFFSLSSGSRSFLRYSYGDLLAEDRKYAVLHRIWPGTQRLLLWGDPVSAAALGKNWSFCGTDGMELMEPLAFKGRKGSGKPGNRDGYADALMTSPGGGWEKYLYTYRMWGRLSYNPDAKPETWKRFLKNQFGAGAEPVEAALGGASRLLPLITSAHAPSAGNNTYWPEMYLNMPIVSETRRGLYSDSPSPRRFGTVSPLDPQIFLTIDESAKELLDGTRSGKYSPAEVAQWLEKAAQQSARELGVAQGESKKGPEFHRMAVDIAIVNGTGMFFAWKFRAGVLYAIYEQSGHGPALEQALAAYKKARAAWADFSSANSAVYVADVTFGLAPELRGNWADRLAAMDADIADMQKILDQPSRTLVKDEKAATRAMAEVMSPMARLEGTVQHVPIPKFKRGEAVTVEMTAKVNAGTARLYYRRVNQAEVWRELEMREKSEQWTATVPAEYTDSAFPLQYYFELRDERSAWLHPGLGANLMQCPYYVVRQG